MLNQDFAPAKISFCLRNTTYTINPEWANGAKETYGDMMQTLQQGGNDALNMYFVENPTFRGFPDQSADEEIDLLGIATFPWDAVAGKPTTNNVLVTAGTEPGGNRVDVNLGRTAVHEAGHWLGLYHPWEHGGCIADPNGGDRVLDTPAMANASFGCEVGRDSCPGIPGDDPIRNYMAYSDE